MKRHTFSISGFPFENLQPKKDACVIYLNSHNQGKDLWAIGKSEEVVLSIGRGCFESLQSSISSQPDWWFGYLSYDIKNELEALHSANHDSLAFPDGYFFRPVHVVEKNGETWFLHSTIASEAEALRDLESYFENRISAQNLPVRLSFRTSKKSYLSAIEILKKRIRRGDIYEANYCHELFATAPNHKPFKTYTELTKSSPTPFAAYVQTPPFHIMCASPERFIKKQGTRIVSQPIKGTRPRGTTPIEDDQLRKELFTSEKDRRENVMIVDMVRNDLSRSAAPNSVKVDELFGIHTFPQVHQMISTISSELKHGVHPIEAIARAYPMGSMTGTPKIRAMEIIEEVEDMKRGVYSGTIGYFTPSLDFDFNVVIRSLLFNSENNYLSCCVGGAITDLSDPEEEYEETLVKASAIRNVLNTG